MLQSNSLYGHADISLPNTAIKKIRFEHWLGGSNTDASLRAANKSSIIINVLCVTPACTKPDAGADMSACAGTCMNLTGTNPGTGTWVAMSGNPAGATLRSDYKWCCTSLFFIIRFRYI